MGGQSESLNIEFEDEFELDEVRALLAATPGIIVKDDPAKGEYPMPLLDAQGRDEVFVGRIRRDESQPRTLNLWVVADNLRKGAATNRSEEHTSELQSLMRISYAVFCLKKKNKN